MELIYTTRGEGFKPGKQYRNPRYFDRPESQASAVTLEGDFPEIKAAYESVGVPVAVPDKPVASSSDEKPSRRRKAQE